MISDSPPINVPAKFFCSIVGFCRTKSSTPIENRVDIIERVSPDWMVYIYLFPADRILNESFVDIGDANLAAAVAVKIGEIPV